MRRRRLYTKLFMRWIGYNYDSTSIRRPFDDHSIVVIMSSNCRSAVECTE